MTHLASAATFAAVFIVLYVAHHLGDHIGQPGRCAALKARRDWIGVRALLTHVSLYTVITAVPVLLTWPLLGLAISPAGLALGLTFSAVTHAWADMRWTLEGLVSFTARWAHRPGLAGRLARALDNSGFYRLGRPRQARVVTCDETGQPITGPDGDPHVVTVDQPILTTGANRVDQDFHYLALGGTALMAATVPAQAWAITTTLVVAMLAALAGLIAVALRGGARACATRAELYRTAGRADWVSMLEVRTRDEARQVLDEARAAGLRAWCEQHLGPQRIAIGVATKRPHALPAELVAGLS